eukprot:g33.t1
MDVVEGSQRKNKAGTGADGSIRYAQGNTKVMVAVFGPMRPTRARQEKRDRASIDVVVEPAVGIVTPKEKEYQKIIRQTYESVILTESFPRTLIRIVVQVISDQGSLLSTMINAVCLALMDAGIEMEALVGSVTCEIDADSNRVLLDPEYDTRTCKSDSSSSARPSVCVALRTGSPVRVLASVTRGKLSAANYFRCVEEANSALPNIAAFYRIKATRHYGGYKK